MSRNLLFSVFPVLINLHDRNLFSYSLTDAFRLANLVAISESDNVDLKSRCVINDYLSSIGFQRGVSVNSKPLLHDHQKHLVDFSKKLYDRIGVSQVNYE